MPGPARLPRPAKPIWFLLLSLPMAWLAIRWALLLTGRDVPSLTAEPIKYSINYLGIWSIRMLLLSLAISPAAEWSGRRQILALRRMTGLFAFTYVSVHLLFFFGFDLLFSVQLLLREIARRRYILFGMGAFACLLPLAITSTRGWQKRLGGRRWLRLHRLVYLAAVLAAIHFLLLVKGNQMEPWIYAGLFALLLLLRLKRSKRPASARRTA